MASDGEWRRTVHCKDFRGRDRALTATLSDDSHLVLVVPAGEAAILDLGTGGDQLKRLVDDARMAAAEQAMGRRPSAPLTGLLQEAATFYVLDRGDRQQRLGVGLNGSLAAVNGPGYWQGDDGTFVAVANKMLSLAQILRRR